MCQEICTDSSRDKVIGNRPITYISSICFLCSQKAISEVALAPIYRHMKGVAKNVIVVITAFSGAHFIKQTINYSLCWIENRPGLRNRSIGMQGMWGQWWKNQLHLITEGHWVWLAHLLNSNVQDINMYNTESHSGVHHNEFLHETNWAI